MLKKLMVVIYAFLMRTDFSVFLKKVKPFTSMETFVCVCGKRKILPVLFFCCLQSYVY